MRALRWIAILGVAAGTACGAAYGAGDPDAFPTEAGAETGSPVDAGVPSDAGRDADPDTGDAGCPVGRGPNMIALGPTLGGDRFCIDTTEVTVANYTQFKMAGVSPASQSSDCAWNTSFAPGDGPSPNHPVVKVNWCDAKAFCAWAGKRLCGAVAGGTVPAGNAGTPEVAQWLYACTNRGTSMFPYPGAYKAGACNIGGDAASPAAPVGSSTQCVTLAGARDLLGNVWEWVDSCQANDAGIADDTCHWVGGAAGAPINYACNVVSGGNVTTRVADIGFRCCADLD